MISEQGPPELTVAEAMERLAADRETFVFFVNALTGRGNVIYRRYDGHYGLVTPAEANARTGLSRQRSGSTPRRIAASPRRERADASGPSQGQVTTNRPASSATSVPKAAQARRSRALIQAASSCSARRV